MTFTHEKLADHALTVTLKGDPSVEDVDQFDVVVTEMTKDNETLAILLDISEVGHLSVAAILEDFLKNLKHIKDIGRIAVVDKAVGHSGIQKLMLKADLFSAKILGIKVKFYTTEEMSEAKDFVINN